MAYLKENYLNFENGAKIIGKYYDAQNSLENMLIPDDNVKK